MQLPQQAAGNVQANAELFREAFVTLRPPHQRRVTAFGETRPRVPGERVGDVDVAKSHQRVRQRFVERLSVADRQQMLLATAFDDFKKVCVRQTAGASQNRRGHLRAVRETQAVRMVWRGARSMVDRASLSWITVAASTRAIRWARTPSTAAIWESPRRPTLDRNRSVTSPKIRASCSGPSSSAPFNSLRRSDDSGRHGYPTSAPVVPGSPHDLISASSRHAFRPTVRNASSSGHSIARMAGVFVDPSAAE